MILFGKFILLCVSLLLSVSWGGQVVAAPILVPLIVLAIGTASKPGAIGWALLGSLLSLEAGGMYVAIFRGPLGLVIGIGAITLGVGACCIEAAARLRAAKDPLSSASETGASFNR
jgi:hypothetical protein